MHQVFCPKISINQPIFNSMVKKRIPQKVKQEITRYLNVLKQDNLPIKKVLLFGSYAKGNAHEWSDIDLCVVSPKFKTSWDVLQFLWFKRQRGLRVEPVGYTTKDFQEGSSLINEIKKYGIEIKV